MDPLETINIAGDSTFAIMLSAQARGHSLYHYVPGELGYGEGSGSTPARPVTGQRVEGGHFSFDAPGTLDLREDVDVVLMRQDPPFDLAYITATHLLERVQDRTLVVNDPAAVRNAPAKLFVLDFQQFMPPTLVTRRPEDPRPFNADHVRVGGKTLSGNPRARTSVEGG